MRYVFNSIFCLLFVSKTVVVAQATGGGFAVVELFTSQSDINGPPAGRVLKELEQTFKGKEAYFLEYHVEIGRAHV